MRIARVSVEDEFRWLRKRTSKTNQSNRTVEG